jgi:steroid 5-alpha reductase family enzyme
MNEWALAAIAIGGLMIALWLYSLLSKDASIVDRWWAIGFIVAAVVAGQRSWILIPAGIWAARLSGYLAIRNWGKPDARYEAWRMQYPNWPIRSLFQVFLLQGALMYVASLPLVHGNPTGIVAWIGLGLFVLGFCVEAIADAQLGRHQKHGTGALRTGLWGISRHPNYLGEAILWWGLGLIGASGGAWWVLIGSAVVHGLVRYVSGVPMLEKRMAGREKYADYVKEVPVFLPWLKP